jgi:hypothetical protein
MGFARKTKQGMQVIAGITETFFLAPYQPWQAAAFEWPDKFERNHSNGQTVLSTGRGPRIQTLPRLSRSGSSAGAAPLILSSVSKSISGLTGFDI